MSLSEKIVYPSYFPKIEGWIDPKDVKESTKKILKHIKSLNFDGCNAYLKENLINYLKEEFGEELI